MKRRNFLKLFGLLAIVPTSASAIRGIKVPPSFQQIRARKKREINLYVTLENKFNGTHGKHRIIKSVKRGNDGNHIIDYGDWSDTYLVHGICVDADTMITVETQNGTSVSFTPIPNPYQDGKFESVNITTVYGQDIFQTYKLKATPIL